MKILIHGLNFSPEKIGVGKYSGELAAWLVKAGHEVHVVTSPPYYPDWRIQAPYKSWQYHTEIWNGVKVVRCPLWVPRKLSGVKRIFHLLSFAISSFFAMVDQIKYKPDVVISIAPTLFAASTSVWIARMCKAVSWLHIQDFELDAAASLGMVQSKRFMMKLARRWEKSVFLKFDKVSSISNQMVKLLHTKGLEPNKTVLFPNWVDTNTIFPILNSPNPYRERMGISENQIVLLYSGNMGAKQGLEVIIEVARRLRERSQFVFILCGNGPNRSNLEKISTDLPNLKFLDLQPPEQFNLVLNAADIHLLPQQAGAADLVMPSKLLGMLASGRPVITTALEGTELANIVSQTGIVVPPEDVDELVQTILLMSLSSEKMKKPWTKSLNLVNENWSQEKVLFHFMTELITLKSMKKTNTRIPHLLIY